MGVFFVSFTRKRFSLHLWGTVFVCRCSGFQKKVLDCSSFQENESGFQRALCSLCTGFVRICIQLTSTFLMSLNRIIRNMQHLMQRLSGVSGVSFWGFLAIFPAALFDLCRGLKTCVSSFSSLYHGFRGFSRISRISFRYL